MTEFASPPELTLLAEDRLVAYLWRRADGGQLRRGSGRDQEPLLAIGFADILVLDRLREPLLVRLAEKAEDLEAFLFAVQLEGVRVVPGAVTPHARRGRF